MAGSERSGPEAADAQLFQGATWVLTPTAATADATLTELSAFLRRLGARVVALSPEQHDELVAVVSHLPQVVASTLAAVAADAIEATGDAVLAVAGGGFRDTTRIAASDPALWVPILSGNRPAVLEALDAYTGASRQVRAAVDGERWEELVPSWPGPARPGSGWCRRPAHRPWPTWSCRWTTVPASSPRPRPRSVPPASTSRTWRCATPATEGAAPCWSGSRPATSARAVEVLTGAGLGAHVEHDAAAGRGEPAHRERARVAVRPVAAPWPSGDPPADPAARHRGGGPRLEEPDQPRVGRRRAGGGTLHPDRCARRR
jgi:hypothetical protein